MRPVFGVKTQIPQAKEYQHYHQYNRKISPGDKSSSRTGAGDLADEQYWPVKEKSEKERRYHKNSAPGIPRAIVPITRHNHCDFEQSPDDAEIPGKSKGAINRFHKPM